MVLQSVLLQNISTSIVGIFLLSFQVYASSDLQQVAKAELRCGFPVRDAKVTNWDGKIPILIEEPFSVSKAQKDFLLRKRRLADSEGLSSQTRCHSTEFYLKQILGRLIIGSQLQSFSQIFPEIRLVLQCSRFRSLPVARASAGRILLVPFGLPYQAESEDAIAAVLAHELAHMTLRHTERLMKALSSTQRGSREKLRHLKLSHEREADITGLRLLANAGYDPMAAIDHLKMVDNLAKKLNPPFQIRRGVLHDTTDVRVELLAAQLKACGYNPVATRKPVSQDVQLEMNRMGLKKVQSS